MKSSFIKRNRFIQGLFNLERRVTSFLADNQLFGLASGIETLLSKLSQDVNHQIRSIEYEQLGNIIRKNKDLNSSDKSQYPIFVTNLDRAKERLQQFDRRASRLGMSYKRIGAFDTMNPAFDFRPYRSQIGETFWGGSTSIKRGIIGCYLTQALIWKEIVDKGIEHSIVLEDDAYPLINFQKVVDQFDIPSDYHVVFINSRAGEWFIPDIISKSIATEKFVIYPYHDVIERMIDLSGTIMAPGGDGLIVSYEGAEKLLEILQMKKICYAPDWMIALHSIEPSFLQTKLNEIPDRDRKGISALPVSEVGLRSYIMLPSLVEHRDQGISYLDHSNLSKRIDRSEIG